MDFNFAKRLIEAMPIRKKDIEPKVDSLLDQAFEHLGYLACIQASPELVKEWTDEIKSKYLVHSWRLVSKVNNLKTKEVAKWVARSSVRFTDGAESAFTDRDYKTLKKRFDTEEATKDIVHRIPVKDISAQFLKALTEAKSTDDVAQCAKAAVDIVLKHV
jgi:hypothetical protein